MKVLRYRFLGRFYRGVDGQTRTNTDEHGRNGEGVWCFAGPSSFVILHSSFAIHFSLFIILHSSFIIHHSAFLVLASSIRKLVYRGVPRRGGCVG